jgi:hypothetical protein
VSASRPLTVAAPQRPVTWRAAVEAAVRSEFRETPLVPPPGSPLLPAACAVPGCVRTGFTAPWGRFQARLCHGHADRWIADGRPADSAGWVAAQTPLLVMAPTVACDVVGCPRSAAKAGLCRSHQRLWRDRGKPPLEGFVRSASRPRRVLAGVCRAPDCEFPAGDRLGVCDRHIDTFHAWRHHRVRVGDPDPSIEAYLENVTSRADGTAQLWLQLPDRELLELELRFVIQAMHDDGKGLIAQARWRELVRELNALGVESLLDHDLDWWDAHRPAGFDRAPRWLCYLKRGWRALFAFRAPAPACFGLGINRPAGRLGGLACLRDLGHPDSQVLDSPLDRLLGQLSVQRPVDDDRPGVLELDEHSGSAGLVDVALGEPHRWRAVCVTVKLLVQRGGFVEQCLGLLAQPQISDLVAVELGQMGCEHLARAAAKRGVDHPSRLACEALGRPLVAVPQVADHGFEQLRADLADAAQLLDGGKRDHPLASQLLRLLGQLEQPHARSDALLGPPEGLRGAILGQAAVEHGLDRMGFLN